MSRCNYCGKETADAFKCSHCGSEHCQDHRLPEYHDCPLFVKAEAETPTYAEVHAETRTASGIEAPEPMDPSENKHSRPGSSSENESKSASTSSSESQSAQKQKRRSSSSRSSTDSRSRQRSSGKGTKAARTTYYKGRAWVKAPFHLLLDYLIPILAFLVVFGGVIYILS